MKKMTKKIPTVLATVEQMHQVGQQLQQMRPAFKALRDTHPLKKEFMSLTRVLPIKHDGQVYALHAALISDCARRINLTLAGTASPKKWKK
jgi:hypothetical protein